MDTRTIRRALCAALLAVALQAPAATLYEQDGVSLDGSVRLAGRAAATCVAAPDADEATQANAGQPLHVWRLDYGVYNGSGRGLSQVTAHVRIESEWPPCSSWDGPEARFPGPLEWAGSYKVLQRSGGLAAAGEARETAYVLAFHDRQPRFDRWQLDFRFGEASGEREVPELSSVPAAATVKPDPKPPVLPLPEPSCEGKPAGSKCWLELANQAGCYSWTDHFMSHLRHAWDGECDGGLPNGPGTLRITWTWGGGGTGWAEVTGEMRGGREHGLWEYRNSEGGSGRGPYVHGKRHGDWVERDKEVKTRYVTLLASVAEGRYVDGERHGLWTYRFSNGEVKTHRYVRGKLQD